MKIGSYFLGLGGGGGGLGLDFTGGGGFLNLVKPASDRSSVEEPRVAALELAGREEKAGLG